MMKMQKIYDLDGKINQKLYKIREIQDNLLYDKIEKVGVSFVCNG
jgi:hypothetical protein